MNAGNIDEYLKFIAVRRRVTFICLLTRTHMSLAKAVEPARQEKKQRLTLALLAVALGMLGGLVPARSECLSPSAEAGATTTTVYRCQEGDTSGGQQPVIVDPGKTTVVERGSADVPWFAPKPTQTADPIQVPKSAPGKEEPAKKEEVVKIEPLPTEAAKAAETEVMEPKAAKPKVAEPEATKTEAAESETPAAEPKVGKTKKTKATVAKAKRSKVKLAKSKRTKSKLAQKRTKVKSVAAEAKPPEEIKTEPAKTDPPETDSKIIVMTRKNMPLGSRIKNWFGL